MTLRLALRHPAAAPDHNRWRVLKLQAPLWACTSVSNQNVLMFKQSNAEHKVSYVVQFSDSGYPVVCMRQPKF